MQDCLVFCSVRKHFNTWKQRINNQNQKISRREWTVFRFRFTMYNKLVNGPCLLCYVIRHPSWAHTFVLLMWQVITINITIPSMPQWLWSAPALNTILFFEQLLIHSASHHTFVLFQMSDLHHVSGPGSADAVDLGYKFTCIKKSVLLTGVFHLCKVRTRKSRTDERNSWLAPVSEHSC